MELHSIRFGLLTAQVKTIKGNRVAWECACDCGSRVVVAQVDLRAGDTRSCGCLRRKAMAHKNTTHGKTGTPAYKKWLGMWSRTNRPDDRGNRCYASVLVCARWKAFAKFYADMGDPPPGFSLDRIDNQKGYFPHNCRWVPLSEQARNTRRLRIHQGVHISELARRAGLSPDVVFDRINKLGWPVERALTTPKRKMACS
ncbi:MAG: hypothetical protein RLZZ573_1628 [Pseudomonadota bacterium]|jgi:hypothetical protein